MFTNSIFFGGLAGKDGEVRTTSNGKSIGMVSVCHTEKGKDGREDTTTWVNAKSFGYLAPYFAQIKKGDNVMIEGSLNVSNYKTKNNESRTSVDIFVKKLSVAKRFERIETPSNQMQKSRVDEHGNIDWDDVPF